MDSVRIESNRKVPQTIRLSLGVLDMYERISVNLLQTPLNRKVFTLERMGKF